MAESPQSGEEIIPLDEESRVNSPSDENQIAAVPASGESSRNGSQQSQLVDMTVTEDNPIFLAGRSQDSEVVSIQGDPNVTEMMSQLQSNVQSAIVPRNQSQQLMLHSGEEHSTTQLVPVESSLVPMNSSQQLVLHSVDSQTSNQLIPVDIGGGEFHGARFGPTNTATHKTGCIEGGDFSGARLGPTNIYYINQGPSTSGDSQAKREMEETSGEDEDYVQISDDIFINDEEPLREGTRIYKGYQQHVSGDRRPLAIKTVFPFNDTHVKEVGHLVNLGSHPNIVQIIRSKVTKGPPRVLYIVMELCSSQNLQDYLDENCEQNIPFDFKKTMSFTKQLVSSMTHIHRNGIVHRDIKPENVLLSKDGSQLKVTDFGLGKQLRPGSSVTKTRTGGQGSDGFIPPEGYSTGEISQRADVFSLGITLSNLWTNGKHPFGSDPDLLIYNIKKNKGLDFSGLLISGPKRDQLVDLVTKMLQHDPRLRPTMQEVADHPFFKDEPTSIEVSSGQVDNGISEQDHPGQNSSEILERTFSPAVETIPKEFTSMSLPPFAPDITPSASGNLHAIKMKGSSGFSRVRRRKQRTPRDDEETSTPGVSESKRRKEGTSREDEEFPAMSHSPSVPTGNLHGAEMEETSTSGVSEPKRRKEGTSREDEDSTSSLPPSASDIITPSASGNLLAAEREARARHLLKDSSSQKLFPFSKIFHNLKNSK